MEKQEVTSTVSFDEIRELWFIVTCIENGYLLKYRRLTSSGLGIDPRERYFLSTADLFDFIKVHISKRGIED